MNEQNNFLMAIVLSLAVLLGWQFLVTEPRMAEERARQQAAAAQNTQNPGAVQNAPQENDLANDLVNDLGVDSAPQTAGTAPQVARTKPQAALPLRRA